MLILCDIWRNTKGNIPAIVQLIAHILQIRIPHILNGKYEAVLVLIQTFPDIGKEF
jgi:hypothetical protein